MKLIARLVQRQQMYAIEEHLISFQEAVRADHKLLALPAVLNCTGSYRNLWGAFSDLLAPATKIGA